MCNDSTMPARRPGSWERAHVHNSEERDPVRRRCAVCAQTYRARRGGNRQDAPAPRSGVPGGPDRANRPRFHPDGRRPGAGCGAFRAECSRGAPGVGREQSGLPQLHRTGVFGVRAAAGDPARNPREPGLVYSLHSLPAGNFPGPAGSAAQFPDDDCGPDRPAGIQRIPAG